MSHQPIESTGRNIEPALRDIQASEAKTHLPRILDEVERGQTVRITRHGRPIARIVPESDRRQAEVDQAITNPRAWRSRIASTSVALTWTFAEDESNAAQAALARLAAWRRPRRQPQVREDPADHRTLRDRRDDPQLNQVGMMLITLRSFMPLVLHYGWDPLWFGVMFLISTHDGAEPDLLITGGSRRVGVEFRRSDAPGVTPSMRIAQADLAPDASYVVYPGSRRDGLADGIEAVPLSAWVGRRDGPIG